MRTLGRIISFQHLRSAPDYTPHSLRFGLRLQTAFPLYSALIIHSYLTDSLWTANQQFCIEYIVGYLPLSPNDTSCNPQSNCDGHGISTPSTSQKGSADIMLSFPLNGGHSFEHPPCYCINMKIAVSDYFCNPISADLL